MPIEEQLENDADDPIYSSAIPGPRYGQKLTILDRNVTKIAFLLRKYGNPPGQLYLGIYRVSDDGLIVEKLWGDSKDVPGANTWIEVDSPTYVNEEVRMCARITSGNASDHIKIRYRAADVKAGEVCARWQTAAWNDIATRDTAYKYTYEEGAAGWSGKIAGVTNPAKVTRVDVANIAKVMGVA